MLENGHHREPDTTSGQIQNNMHVVEIKHVMNLKSDST